MSFFKLSVLAVSGAEALSLGRSPVTSMLKKSLQNNPIRID